MSRRTLLSLQRVSAVAALLLTTACESVVTTPPPRLKGPTDSVAAGPVNAQGDLSYLFVAGSEASSVYAIELQSLIFFTGPSKLFPLEIPTCRAPSALAATADGKLVMVSCAADDAVQIIDAFSLLRVRDARGVPLTATVGQGSERLLAMPTQTDGKDRFLSINSYGQSLTFLHLERPSRQNAQGGSEVGPPTSIVVDRTLQVAATIARGVLNADGTSLYTADPTSHFVHRIDLATGAVTNFDARAATVDVALAKKGAIVDGLIYAATPASESITVIDAQTGAVLNTNPTFAPLLPDGADFGSVFLGEIPRRIRVVDMPNQALELTCSISNGTVGNDSLPRVNRFLLVATETGPVYYIDIDSNTLVNTTDCVPPTVRPTDLINDTSLFTTISPFASCQTGSLKRLPCDHATGVTYFPNHTQKVRVVLDYEAVLPNANRSNGGGTLVDSHTIRDVSNDYRQPLGSNTGVQIGDRVIITTPPNVSPSSCRDQYGGEQTTTAREFGVTGITSDGSITIDSDSAQHADQLKLTDCFPFGTGKDSLIGYEVRIGKGFLVTQAAPTAEQRLAGRVGVGETFGADNLERVRFTISTTQAFTRDQIIDFTVADVFTPLRAALTTPNSSTTVAFPAGRVPSSITLANSGHDSTHAYRAFVTYSATDTIAVWQAFVSADADDTSNSHVLQ